MCYYVSKLDKNYYNMVIYIYICMYTCNTCSYNHYLMLSISSWIIKFVREIATVKS